MGAGGDLRNDAAIGRCAASWPTTLGKDAPVAVTSAAAVSSQRDSMPRITASVTFLAGPFPECLAMH